MFVNRKSLTAIWQTCLGQVTEFSLEARVFHAVCLLIMAGTAINIPFNCLIGLGQLGMLMACVLVTIGVVYYLSRFSNRTKLAVTIFQLFSNILLAANYIYNSGVNGPTIAIFLLTLVITLTTVPKKQYALWLALNGVTFLALTFLESSGSKVVRNTYFSNNDRFEDFRYTYVMVGALITFILVFMRKAYEEERLEVSRKAAALSVSDQTKNKLLSILAHDLKDPLASLQNYLELLGEYRIDDAERADIEQQLLQRTKQASEMLVNVLSWTRSQMGGLHADIRPVYIQQALSEIFIGLKEMAKDKGIELISKADRNLCVMADADMLQVILRNLIVNAIKFTYPGGKIEIQTSTAAGRAKIIVADSGIGMTEIQQNALFSLSAESSTGTAQERGTGLGLLLCKNLTELQQGTLSVGSKPGRGTSFTIDLPLCLDYTETANTPAVTAFAERG